MDVHFHLTIHGDFSEDEFQMRMEDDVVLVWYSFWRRKYTNEINEDSKAYKDANT